MSPAWKSSFIINAFKHLFTESRMIRFDDIHVLAPAGFSYSRKIKAIA
jgi:hypothetical protein